jgi:3-hydroxyacyl-[acyl-carrier-protein] dehydratase
LVSFRQQFCISADHPSLSGHFPGNPIIPGVVILDYVKRVLQANVASAKIKSFVQVKFLHPLPPGAEFTIVLTQQAPLIFKFSCECQMQKIVAGSLVMTESI